jgi:hypothetical protein
MKPRARTTRHMLWLATIAMVITITLSLISLSRDRLTAIAAVTPTPPILTKDHSLHLSGNTYTAKDQYDLAILAQTIPATQVREDFSVTSTAGIPLLESPDRTLAYTMIVRQRSQDQTLDSSALTQLTMDTLQRGEGFVAGEASDLAPGLVRLPWTGVGNGEPVVGSVIAMQNGTTVLMLVISATGDGVSQLEPAIALLTPSLTQYSP